MEAVRRQLSRTRRRSNAFALQDAAYRAAAAALSGVSLLLLSALVSSGGAFAVFAWSVFAAVAGFAAAAVRQGRHRWISATDAAVVIDRRAGLEERLVTLLSVEPERSRLWPCLLGQNLRVLPRWAPREFVPRAVPRSAGAAVAAAVLAAAALLVVRGLRPVEVGDIGGEDPQASQLFAESGEAAGAGSASSTGGEASLASLFAEVPERLRQAILGTPAGKARFRSVPANLARAAGPGSRAASDGSPGASPPSRRSVRQEGALSSSAPAGRAASFAGTTRLASSPSEPLRGDRPLPLPPIEVERPRVPSAGDRKDIATRGGGGPGASGGAGSKDDLFGERDPGLRSAGTFEVNLAGRSGGAALEGPPNAARARPVVALAPDPRLDDAIRRAQVPPEYEPIVRRLFRRSGEEGAESGAR